MNFKVNEIFERRNFIFVLDVTLGLGLNLLF